MGYMVHLVMVISWETGSLGDGVFLMGWHRQNIYHISGMRRNGLDILCFLKFSLVFPLKNMDFKSLLGLSIRT